jgi:hypothetical protein
MVKIFASLGEEMVKRFIGLDVEVVKKIAGLDGKWSIYFLP